MEIPDTLEGMQELMRDPKRMGQIIRDGQLEEVVAAHAKLTDERGPLRDMVMEAVTAGMAGAGAIEERAAKATRDTLDAYLKERGVNRPNLGPPEHPQPGTGAKVNACYNPLAPGVRMEEVGFTNLGDFTRAIRHNNPFPDNRLPEIRKIQDAYSSVEPSAGGFLIPETMRSEIMQLALEEAIVRPRATVITLTTPTQSIPFIDSTTNSGSVLGGMVFYWTEEGATPTITQAKFGRVKLEANKLMGLAAVPNELWNDAAALSSWLMQALPKGLAFFEDLAFLTGNGAGQPKGVLESEALIAVDKETDQPADTIVVENILNMFSRMLPGSLGRGVWIANINTFKELMTLSISVGVGGHPVALVDIRSGPLATMLTRPLIFTEKVPTLGDQGDIGFYDLGYYLIGDRQAIEISTSEHAYFTSDQTALKPVERVDGRPWVQSAVTPVYGSTLSPYVVLAARA
jgi:HK97 family phage major capsid protein